MVSSPNATAPVQEGEILAAKYRIEGVIGVGGMGVVVAAMNLESDRRVALKFLLPQAQQSDELVGRFVREAKASVKLKGTHVAKTLDVGRLDDGRAYIVMEYLEGQDLGAFFKAGERPPTISDAVGWMLQACEGLAEAHAIGIVHRDLKPGNLFLTPCEGGRMLVKLLDFGISKSINPNASDMLSLTKTEMLLGSPLYMAPEQMRSSKYVDERSDIWALGAIAYELLTGKVPFEADTLLDLCFKVAQERCPPVDEVRPEVPAELSAVVMRCLEKEAEKRWNDIGTLASALEPFAGPEDQGSAARTIAVLAGGTAHGRARRSQSGLQPVTPVDGALVARTSDLQLTAKTTAEKKLVAPAPPSSTGTSSTSAPATASVPDAAPTSAWGTTQAERLAQAKSATRSKVGMIAGGVGIVALAAAGGLLLSRAGTEESHAPVAVASSSIVVTLPPPTPYPLGSRPPQRWPTPPPPPPPAAAPEDSAASGTAGSTSTFASPSASAAPRPSSTVPPAHPRPKPSLAAAPAASPSAAKPAAPESSGGFLKVRE